MMIKCTIRHCIRCRGAALLSNFNKRILTRSQLSQRNRSTLHIIIIYCKQSENTASERKTYTYTIYLLRLLTYLLSLPLAKRRPPTTMQTVAVSVCRVMSMMTPQKLNERDDVGLRRTRRMSEAVTVSLITALTVYSIKS